MYTRSEYLENPCRVSSLPDWKLRSLSLPPSVMPVHAADFSGVIPAGMEDTRYFRLRHDLRAIDSVSLPEFRVVSAERADFACMAQLINRSYPEPCITPAQLEHLTTTPVYDPTLWILVCDRETGAAAGCGIADYDAAVSEGILEWIQVVPEYRRRGVGRLIVCTLLSRMRHAAFATVSGCVDNPSNPEGLYRRCGFTGNDIWHVLQPKN